MFVFHGLIKPGVCVQTDLLFAEGLPVTEWDVRSEFV